MVKTPRVHDLVCLHPDAIPQLVYQARIENNAWLENSGDKASWAVVRRAHPTTSGHIAVGFRGSSRNQRWGTEIPAEYITAVTAPYEISSKVLPGGAAFQAFNAFDEMPYKFGPGGSVGFELASGIQSTHPDSDLDLVIYADSPLSVHDIRTIRHFHQRAAVFATVDILIETPLGGVAFSELERAMSYSPMPSMMLRTHQGPELSNIIWR